MEAVHSKRPAWLDRPLLTTFTLSWEVVLFAVIVTAAVVTRFYDLGARVMSHDESLHTYFSWVLYKGNGFAHTPLMHGPLQFHLLALTYFLFGDSDFTARIPVVLFSIAAVIFLWRYRRYLGRTGALIAAALFTISPYMLYYGRYVRNESYVAFFGLVAIWALLRYLDTGKQPYLYYLTAATVLHFSSKETSFIYAAQALLFLLFVFINRLLQRPWRDPADRRIFLALLALAAALFTLAAASSLIANLPETLSPGEIPAPPVPGQGGLELAEGSTSPLALWMAGGGLLAVLLSLVFLVRGLTIESPPPEVMRTFVIALASVLLAVALVVALAYYVRGNVVPPVDPAVFAADTPPPSPVIPTSMMLTMLGISVLIAAGAGAASYFLVGSWQDIWPFLRREHSFDLLVLLGSLVLPHLSAFPVRLMGWVATDYSTAALVTTGIFLIPMAGIAIGVGLGWKPMLWLKNIALFYSIFVVFFTTVFTNSSGFWSGLVGSLGYWLEQQGVKRGNQPWYFYILVQVPVYEYLAALGTLLAAALGIRWLRRNSPRAETKKSAKDTPAIAFDEVPPRANPRRQALTLLAFWTVTSMIAYTVAGEKMPWLTVHIALPMLLLAGWSIGRIIEMVDWRQFSAGHGWVALLLLPIAVTSVAGIVLAYFSPTPPFQGDSLDALQATSGFLLSLLAAAGSIYGLVRILRSWPREQVVSVGLTAVFAFLAVLTARTAFTASYINYDRATEYLVYAHSARGVKDALARIEDISMRTTDGLAVGVAYDDDVSWPFTWYLRNYTNARFYGKNPSRDLRNLPVILVGDNNYSKIEPIVGQGYYRFDYIRMVWPNQDYFDLTAERIRTYITDPALRSGIFEIWLNRNYIPYGQAAGHEITISNWSPSDRMRLYVRKDIVAQIWDYGVAPAADVAVADPYEGKEITLAADSVIDFGTGAEGSLNAPRDIALAPDGSIYVTDSRNNQIKQYSANGTLLNAWGETSTLDSNNQPLPGTFNEPWGVAVSPDGRFVYVADTWNHRIQKFTADGRFISQWGFFDQTDDPFAFWGPRGIAVDNDGNVYVTNTGNKRVTVFDANGNFLTQFGELGFGPGQFDEPVGIAISPTTGRVFVADTWNQRIQAFDGNVESGFVAVKQWDVAAWYGQSLENKPYLAVAADGNLYVTDPEGSRILVFSQEGDFLFYWGQYSVGTDGFGVALGITPDNAGGLWVSDSANNRLLHFTLPQ